MWRKPTEALAEGLAEAIVSVTRRYNDSRNLSHVCVVFKICKVFLLGQVVCVCFRLGLLCSGVGWAVCQKCVSAGRQKGSVAS